MLGTNQVLDQSIKYNLDELYAEKWHVMYSILKLSLRYTEPSKDYVKFTIR